MTKGELFLRKHSSTILTIVGSVGVVVTSVLAVKATPKALELIEEERQSRKEHADMFSGNELSYDTVILPDLTKMEIVKVAWKPYIPAIISGISTIACIFGANYLNKRTQASLISAYALLNNSYEEYRDKVKKSCPEESKIFEHEIIKSKFNSNIFLSGDEQLFFDYQSMRYFDSTLEKVKRAEYLLNEKLSTYGNACLNDFYDFLNIDHVPYGYQLGWSTEKSDKTYGETDLLEFDYDTAELDDGLEFTIITIKYPPSLEYMS